MLHCFWRRKALKIPGPVVLSFISFVFLPEQGERGLSSTDREVDRAKIGQGGKKPCFHFSSISCFSFNDLTCRRRKKIMASVALRLVFTSDGVVVGVAVGIERRIRSSENQIDEVGSRTLILLMTPPLTIKWKLHCRSRKQQLKNKPMTIFDPGPCNWLVLPLLLPTPTT